MTQPSFSQSLERGLRILSEFAANGPVLGIADLARAVDLNRSTTHRYVATLTSLGFLQQDPDTRKYSLGPRVVDLGFAAISRLAGIIEEAAGKGETPRELVPALRAAMEATREELERRGLLEEAT